MGASSLEPSITSSSARRHNLTCFSTKNVEANILSYSIPVPGTKGRILSHTEPAKIITQKNIKLKIDEKTNEPHWLEFRPRATKGPWRGTCDETKKVSPSLTSSNSVPHYCDGGMRVKAGRFVSILFSRYLASIWLFSKWKTSAVSTTEWVVETQLWKLRDTSDTLIGRACYVNLVLLCTYSK